MNKILNYILIFFLFILLSCGYKPVLTNKNYKFSISPKDISGDQKINSIIIEKFNSLGGEEEEFYVSLSTTKERNIISKDSKGDPAIFELIINVNYNVERKEKILFQKNISKKTTYNNISDKFELDSYEKNIINNLSIDISDRIIFSISEISE
tara:strand:+ start:1031 stop:1489 length:459 start_codon:yes stop_codon:yes gene_type:complete